MSDNQIKALVTLFQLRTLFVLKYAYFDEKKNIFNRQWRKAIEDLISLQNINESYAVRTVVKALEDPHVNYSYQTLNIKGLMDVEDYNLFPFNFSLENNDLLIKKAHDPYHKLPSDTALIENNMKILEINGILSNKWIDSIEQKAGPFFLDKNSIICHMLFYFFLLDKPTVFKVINPKTQKEETFEISRKPISKQDHEEIFKGKIPKIALLQHKRPRFHYIVYEEQNNKSLIELLNTGQPNDTLVIDFRGYPKNDLFLATQLLWGTEEKKVAYSLIQNPKTSCFDIREEMTSYNKKQIVERKIIEEKHYVIYGIISELSASYIETAIMTCKSYIPNFTLIGSPTLGALGTIDIAKLSDRGKITYPYHKFEFYNTNQMNARKQTIPDINMTKQEINSFILYGRLKKN